MKIKKKIAALLAVSMSLVHINIMANPQNGLPAGGISPIEVSYTQSSTTKEISPKAKVTFKPALDNAGTTTIPANDQTRPEQYIIKLQDSLGSPVISSRAVAAKKPEDLANDKYTVMLGDEGTLLDPTKFKPGRLYKLWVDPQHFHLDNNGQPTVLSGRINQDSDPVKYFFTDFNTTMEQKEDKIEITWEYIPGAEYKVHYIKEAVQDYNKIRLEGQHSDLLTENNIVTRTENDVKKVVFTLANIDQGIEYSAYVSLENISHPAFLKDSFENIANAGSNMSNPKIAQTITTVFLEAVPIGRDYIELIWTLNESLQGKLVKTVINSQTVGSNKWDKIGTIYNKDASVKDTGRFEYTAPTADTIYQVIFELEDGSQIKTNLAPFNPTASEEQPLKPQVPEPFANELKLATGFNQKDYTVAGDDVDTDKMLPNTFHVASKNPVQIQLVWDAQYKKGTEATIDPDIEYYIWVADDQALLADDVDMQAMQTVKPSNASFIYNKANKTIGFKQLLSQYSSSTASGIALTSNKTYYIKIVARRASNQSESQATIVAITIDKNGDIFAPPVLAKPPLRVEEGSITPTSVRIEWLEKWHEIRVNDLSKYTPSKDFFVTIWNAVVYLRNNYPIRFKAETNFEELILKDETDVAKAKAAVGGASAFDQDYTSREVILGSDIKYEVKTLLYDDVLKEVKEENINNGVDMTTPSAFTIEKWIVENESDSQAGWSVASDIKNTTKDGFTWKSTAMEGLRPNTRYILLIRAYRILEDGTKLKQTFPSYVIATTSTDYEPPEATPTAPTLNKDGVTESSVAVWWTYNEDFDYEIVYSRLEDPNKATSWKFEISNVPGQANYVSNGSKASVKITGLVPETTYNVWIRAKQKKGDKVSVWSNAVTQTTDSIGKPDAPRGLGPAAYQSILEAGQDFKPIASDYITVEWLRDVNDAEGQTDSTKQQITYSYTVEFADNPEFLDSTVVNTSDTGANKGGDYEIVAKNIIKFKKLVANRPYYVKVKTILTFNNQETNTKIIKESEYTNWVRILTKTSSDEYDGGENDNIVTYPDPIIEDYSNGVWTIELVDSGKIISEIISKKEYFYTIKAEKYDNRHDAQIRRIKIPKSIIDTLINQRMELKVVTQVGTYEIPASTLKVYTLAHAAQDVVQLEFQTIPNYKIAHILRSYPENMLKAEQLSINIRGKNKITTVTKLDGYMKVKIKLNTTQEYLYKNLFAYTYNLDRASWQRENHSIETLSDTYITYSTPITGIYALYEKLDTATSSVSNYAMRTLASKYGVSSLGTVYFDYQNVNRDQFVHLLLGIAQNKTSIDLTAPVYADTLTKAQSAGLYNPTSSRTITQEQALVGVVKLYELKTGYKIKPSTVAFNQVSAPYQEAVKKAYAIGLIETINPNQPISYALLCDWLLQVTE